MKHKQAVSLVLCGIMTVSALGLPVLAADTAEVPAESRYTLLQPEKELALDGDTFKLNYNDIEWIMKKDNPAIKGGDRAIKSAEDAEDAGFSGADSDLIAEQMHQVRDQLISGAESLYIMVLKLENQKEDLLRQQKAIERKLRQAEIAYDCGQISKLEMLRAQDGQLQLNNGLLSLNWSIMQMKEKLSVMLGKDADTNLKLYDVELPPDFKMNYEKDRKKAKHQNYEVKINTQKEVYGDPGFWTQVKMTDAAEANFEAAFRGVYRDTLMKQNALTLEQSKFALAEEDYQIAMLNYKHGALSKSAMTDAEDTYLSATNALKNAELDAFAAQETYEWALAGILNVQGGAQ